MADDRQRAKIDEHIATKVLQKDVMLLPVFHPVITPKDEDWEELRMTFSHKFKNQPYEYQNGGLRPLVAWFYVADLARRDNADLAREYPEGIHRANARVIDGRPWSFPEFLHGQKHTPGGTPPQGCSAATAVIGQKAVEGVCVFRPSDGDAGIKPGQERRPGGAAPGR